LCRHECAQGASPHSRRSVRSCGAPLARADEGRRPSRTGRSCCGLPNFACKALKKLPRRTTGACFAVLPFGDGALIDAKLICQERLAPAACLTKSGDCIFCHHGCCYALRIICSQCLTHNFLCETSNHG